MRCIIRIQNGAPVDHPYTLESFTAAFPDIDLENLPSEWAWFDRKLRPPLPEGTTFVFDHSVYELEGDIWTDVWKIRDLTDAEKAELLTDVRTKGLAHLDRLIEDAQSKLDASSTDLDIAMWQDFIDRLNLDKTNINTLITVYNQTKVNYTNEPEKDSDGTWIRTRVTSRVLKLFE